MLDPTPARHTQNSEVFRFQAQVIQKERKSFVDDGVEYKAGNALHHIVNSSGMCAFIYSCMPNSGVLTEFMNAVTGWELNHEDLINTGERIFNIRRAFNIREGISLRKLKIPGRLLGKPPLKRGPLEGVTINEDAWLKEYCAAFDWDPKTGEPSRKKLQELGLEDVVHAI